MPVVESRRRWVPARLAAAGLPVLSRLQTIAPRDRRAWAWLLGEPADLPVPLPASRDEALSVPAFGRGVELLSSTVAGVPLDAHRWDAALGVDVRLADQPNVLTDPDPLADAWQWRYAVTRDLIESGNHLSLLGDMDWRTGRAGWLMPLPAADCGLVTDASRPGWWAWTVGGAMLGPDDVLHVSAGNRSGEVLGLSIINQYAQQLGGQVAAEEWAGRYVSGGGVPPAIIQHPAIVGGDQGKADMFKSAWRKLIRTGEAMLLPMGAVVTPLQTDAERQQLVQARTWNSQLSAMVLGIPPHMLGLPGPTMTYQNVESADVAFIRDVATRWTDPITYAMSKWLMPAGTVVRPRWAARQRTDMATQATTVGALVSAEVITRDEGRQMLGFGPMGTVTQEGTTPEGTPELVPQEVNEDA